MIKNITIVSCHSREGGNLDTCFRRYDTKFISPNSIGFTIPLRKQVSRSPPQLGMTNIIRLKPFLVSYTTILFYVIIDKVISAS
ncbi:hypothetical protein [Candidatus Tisiphia endosymbiont of Hybos culiciformis]|uniref:hypothetical protein n=1 Tax=Candidatus Tisiphia endosymbiont of Hybos culiciformis TaxID=3139331 RepID=UPI003CCAA073